METMIKFGRQVAVVAMMLCLVAACKKVNNNDPEKDKPDPVVGEWQTVLGARWT